MANKKSNKSKVDKQKAFYIIAVLAIVILIAAVVYLIVNNNSNQQVAEITAENCIAEDCLQVEDLEYPVGELEDSYIEALNMAIDDEYKAHATYEKVVAIFGQVRPFSMIVRSEESHIASLKALYDKYGLEIPDDPYVSVTIVDTIAGNCQIGVDAEIANVALYKDELIPLVKDEYPDIASVFTVLMNASKDSHLPAFTKCAN